MFISEIEIENFRNFRSTKIQFNEGINVIIGHNNAGKTNLLKALSLIFDSSTSKRLEIDDFNQYLIISDYEKVPPKIKVSVTLSQSSNEDNELQDDKALVLRWLIDINTPYKAKLTYEFSLPEGKSSAEYEIEVRKLKGKGCFDSKNYWRMMKTKFIRQYSHKIFVGDPSLNNKAEGEDINKFDFQFLSAIRDVESQLFSGKNTLLKEVLSYFLDHELKHAEGIESDEKVAQLEKREQAFYESSQELIRTIKDERINTAGILKYATDTGASIGGVPEFDGELTESELLSALRLAISKQTGIRIPATSNGLGYNNLIYMSVLLAKIQMDCSSWNGTDNVKIFPMLVIEEPEAHLHPSMQYKFLKFLKSNLEKDKQVRQAFITTHSTQITSAVDLDEIICLGCDENDDLYVAYPGKVFNSNDEKEVQSKKYIKRFLDATKSDMLFAKTVILVEGIAEQILLNTLALYIDKDLAEKHIAVVSVGGRYFGHFLKLFDHDPGHPFKKNALCKKVACITDADPQKKNRADKKVSKCFPFELDFDIANFEYLRISSILQKALDDFDNHSNIKICAVTDGKGKTFEYELAVNNPSCRLIVTEGMPVQNKIEELMKAYEEGKTFTEMLEIYPNDQLENAPGTFGDDECRKRALIASRYYKSVENEKGGNSLEIENQLRKNLESTDKLPFVVPPYIEEAINWVSE